MVEVRQVASATFARGGILAKLAVPFRILAGVLRATLAMQRERPDVVVGFGGYPTIPALAAAWLTGRPRMIHEQNGVLGRVNQLFARRVSLIACGTWPTELPKGVRAEPTGNPVRGASLERAAAPYIAPGDYPLQIVVIGGSQGARILSDVVPAAIDLLPNPSRDRVRVAQQARPEDIERVRATCRAWCSAVDYGLVTRVCLHARWLHKAGPRVGQQLSQCRHVLASGARDAGEAARHVPDVVRWLPCLETLTLHCMKIWSLPSPPSARSKPSLRPMVSSPPPPKAVSSPANRVKFSDPSVPMARSPSVVPVSRPVPSGDTAAFSGKNR